MVLTSIGVTGASGMLGRHILSAAAAKGLRVIATSRSMPKHLVHGSDWFAWDLCDWRHDDELDKLFDGAEAIIHCGGPVPQKLGQVSAGELFDASVRATCCIGGWACRRAMPVVYISGAIVYAEPQRDGIVEDDPVGIWAPWWDYSLTKVLSEDLLVRLAENELSLCILRPSSIYGDGMAKSKMVPQFLATARDGGQIRLTRPVEDQINLVHADDVAMAAIDVLINGVTGIYNIAANACVSIRQIAEACIDAVGAGSIAVEPIQQNERAPITRFGLDCTAAKSRFGFAPRFDIAAGVSQMAAGGAV